jgi:hypothetical protein
MLPPSGLFPHFPEDTVARTGCSKTCVAFIEINILVSRQGGVLLGSLKLDSPSRKGSKGKIDHLNRGFLLLARCPQVRRYSMWEKASLSPVLSHHCHLWLRSWGRHLVTSGCIHPTGVPPDQFFIYSF